MEPEKPGLEDLRKVQMGLIANIKQAESAPVQKPHEINTLKSALAHIETLIAEYSKAL